MKEDTYSVYVHRTPDGMYYAGVTTNIKNRWKPSNYNGTGLEDYAEQYGWKNIDHAVIFESSNRREAYKIEDELIRFYSSMGKCLNRKRSGFVEIEDNKTYQREWKRNKSANDPEYVEQRRKRNRDRYANDPEWAEHLRQRQRNKLATPEGKIYSRVKSFNSYYPDRMIETAIEARDKYLESGYIPNYIKNDDL